MRTLRIAAGLALACAFAAPAHAQQRPGAFPSLGVGQSVTGTIADTDPALYERGRFKVYQFQASPGRRYIVTMESGDFDAFLTVGRTVGGITDHMWFNDDAGEGTSSRLRFTVPAAGTYLVLAQSLAMEGTGTFTLRLDTAAIRPPTVHDLRIGAPVQGELAEDDAEFDVEEVEGFYDLYRFQGRQGQRLRLRMDFGEYYPEVEVGRMVNGEFEMLEDVTVGSNGRVMLTLPETGEYYVRAGAFGGVVGPYTLAIEERTAAPTPVTTPVRAGQRVTGELSDGDAELDDGRWYDAYAYTSRGGERLRVDLHSEDFDAYLSVGRMVNGEFHEIASNDDAPDGDSLDSAVEAELSEPGQYVIRATSFGAGAEGAYSLVIGTP